MGKQWKQWQTFFSWALKSFQAPGDGEHALGDSEGHRNLSCPVYGASLIAQLVKNLPVMQRYRFDPWVWKILWRRKWQPTPVFLPEVSHIISVFHWNNGFWFRYMSKDFIKIKWKLNNYHWLIYNILSYPKSKILKKKQKFLPT